LEHGRGKKHETYGKLGGLKAWFGIAHKIHAMGEEGMKQVSVESINKKIGQRSSDNRFNMCWALDSAG
jgi:hypothetical protein